MPQAVIQVAAVPHGDPAPPSAAYIPIDNAKLRVAVDTDVYVRNTNIGGESAYSWQILWQPNVPPGSPADVFSVPSSANPYLHVRKAGSYRIQLTVNGFLRDVGTFRVLYPRTAITTLAAKEDDTEFDTDTGWAEDDVAATDRLQAEVAVGAVEYAYLIGGASYGAVLAVTGAITLKYGTAAAVTIPMVTPATLAAYQSGQQLGFLQGVPGDPSANAVTGEIVRFRKLGGMPLNLSAFVGLVQYAKLYLSGVGIGQVTPVAPVPAVVVAEVAQVNSGDPTKPDWVNVKPDSSIGTAISGDEVAEDLSAQVNGILQTFTCSNVYVPGTIRVFRNGVWQGVAGAGNAYVEGPGANQITTNDVWANGEALYVMYVKV